MDKFLEIAHAATGIKVWKQHVSYYSSDKYKEADKQEKIEKATAKLETYLIEMRDAINGYFEKNNE